MQVTVFYSWQSDTKAAGNRTLILEALEAAARELRSDDSVAIEPVIDRDTLNVPGAPDISSTILRKIDESTVIVADVTIVNVGSDRPSPNPNVLIELGYALKSLSPGRVILVQNTAFGGPEHLPFDLRQRRVITFNSPGDAPERALQRKELQGKLRDALRSLLADVNLLPPSSHRINLSISYKKVKITSPRHDYLLCIMLTNIDTRPIREWHVDVVMPTSLLTEKKDRRFEISQRSNEDSTLFRATNESNPGTIYPEDTVVVMEVPYRIDREIYYRRNEVFERKVTAKIWIDGELACTAEREVRELQNF